MKINKINLNSYGINPEKGRKYENITYVLALIYNLLQTRVEKYLSPYGVSTVQFNLLMQAAYQNDGKGISQVQAATHLIASASNITKLVEKSVREGLLVRKTNPQSRRENIICITKKGQELIDNIWPGYDNLMCSLTEKIPAKNRTQMEQNLNNWFNQLKQEK